MHPRKLGLAEGRSAKRWVDYSLFGHQIVCHEVQNYNAASTANAGACATLQQRPPPIQHPTRLECSHAKWCCASYALLM